MAPLSLKRFGSFMPSYRYPGIVSVALYRRGIESCDFALRCGSYISLNIRDTKLSVADKKNNTAH